MALCSINSVVSWAFGLSLVLIVAFFACCLLVKRFGV